MREKRRVSTRKVSLARTTKERFVFLNWRFTAFRNMLVVPPVSRIVYRVNLEYLGRVVFIAEGYKRSIQHAD